MKLDLTLAEHQDLEHMRFRAKSQFIETYETDMQRIMVFEHFGFEIPSFIDRKLIEAEYEKTNIKAGDKLTCEINIHYPYHTWDNTTEYQLNEYNIYINIPYHTWICLPVDIDDTDDINPDSLKLFTDESIQLIKDIHKQLVKEVKENMQERNKEIQQRKIKKEIEQELEKVKDPQKTNILEKLKKLI